MPGHPEERRIAGLLRELIVQSGTTLETVEKSLDWPAGRLADLLDGKMRLTLEDILEILPLLSATPADFFAWLYGFDPKEAGAAGTRILSSEVGAASALAQRATDRRFETSMRVVKDAITRRASWKQERSPDKKSE